MNLVIHVGLNPLAKTPISDCVTWYQHKQSQPSGIRPYFLKTTLTASATPPSHTATTTMESSQEYIDVVASQFSRTPSKTQGEATSTPQRPRAPAFVPRQITQKNKPTANVLRPTRSAVTKRTTTSDAKDKDTSWKKVKALEDAMAKLEKRLEEEQEKRVADLEIFQKGMEDAQKETKAAQEKAKHAEALVGEERRLRGRKESEIGRLNEYNTKLLEENVELQLRLLGRRSGIQNNAA
ncbi:hypothetical protein K491DRAFT_681663 [Lophiostoma macrostomum CBS 122681]|uniref:Uncharacterized protein n=1 Tax=Lophiostoma macrostomum CBS 122681 TaxID=1314788 RepID=A0A6A6SWG8_9PLEO|nr:hypothetical protein K491DRAFT_681663 [Lophiostoma macrostomum CBS 122681]